MTWKPNLSKQFCISFLVNRFAAWSALSSRLERKENAGCWDDHDNPMPSVGIVLVGLLAFYALKGDFDSDSFAKRQLASFASGNGFVLKETKHFSIHAYEFTKLKDTELNNDFDRLNYNPNRVNLLKFKVKL